MSYISNETFNNLDGLVHIQKDELPISFWDALEDLSICYLTLPVIKTETMYQFQNHIGLIAKDFIDHRLIKFNLFFTVKADFKQGFIEVLLYRKSDAICH